ncbi:probable RNA-directed DNA polymerase from transposon X-element [Trichonephila clavipes]|nr:probable RNA-directed DNA polymerase from transposon X-element [Trichonephila clavipes]
MLRSTLLGPLLFNLYINDIPDYSLTKLNMFTDDTAVHTTYKRISSVTYALNKHLKLLEKYYDQWKISINVEKSAVVIFTKKRKLPPPPTMYNTTIPWSQSTKYLGIIFDKNLTWRTHIQHTRNKLMKIMFKLYPLIGRNSELSRDNKVLLFTAVMRPILAYGCPVWGYAAKTNINILDTLQNSTIQMIRSNARRAFLLRVSELKRKKTKQERSAEQIAVQAASKGRRSSIAAQQSGGRKRESAPERVDWS